MSRRCCCNRCCNSCRRRESCGCGGFNNNCGGFGGGFGSGFGGGFGGNCGNGCGNGNNSILWLLLLFGGCF